VQLGDLIDRGPESFPCLFLAQQMGEIFGWKTVRLLGNHELMGMRGDSGDSLIHYEEIEQFGSVEARNAFFSSNGV
jgi:hypothetical protein